MAAEITEDSQEVAQHYSATLEEPEPEVVEEEQTEEVVELTEEVKAGEEAVETAEGQLEEAAEAGDTDRVNELMGLIREMRRENLVLKTRLEKVETVQNTEMGKEPEPGELESLQNDLNTIAASRREGLETILATMEVNPKYEDVNEVCSKENFNDIFETVAKARADENGTSFDTELLKAKVEIWKMPNPYKYMYEVIKTYHPKYKATEKPAAKVEEKPKPVAKTAKEILAAAQGKEKKPTTAPGSIAGLSGAATEQGGWTAAKIDALDEADLKKVPRDVYNKWLSGELD